MKYHLAMPKIEMTGVKFQSGLVGEINRLTRQFMNQRAMAMTEPSVAAQYFNRGNIQSAIRTITSDEPPQAA